MNITPIDGEPTRFHVQSRSRSWVLHVVDLAYKENMTAKDVQHAACSCEEFSLKGNTCAHIIACVDYEMKRLAELKTHEPT